MTKTFVISDTHFGHRNIITFKDSDDKPLRDFPSVEAMDDHMVECWNSVVSEGDRVYHLGDVVINRKALATLGRLKGKKVLIKGNHDIFKLKDYSKYFDDIRAYKVMPKHGIIMSHIPIHPECLARWKLNIHGHLHSNVVKQEVFGTFGKEEEDDDRYMSVCVEQINYTPVNLQDIIEGLDDD